MYATVTTISKRTMRATPTICVRATGRVPLGLIPVTAARAARTTATASQNSHVIGAGQYNFWAVAPRLATVNGRVGRSVPDSYREVAALCHSVHLLRNGSVEAEPCRSSNHRWLPS